MLTLPTMADDINISTPHSSLLLKADNGQPLHVSYYGEKVDNVNQVYDAYSLWEDAYPAFGRGCMDITCLSVKHADGNMSTELEVTGHDEKTEGQSKVYTIHMKDKVYPLYVDVMYRAWQNTDVIETWQVITNKDKKTISLQQYASAFMPLRRGDVWATHFHGSWGSEAEMTEEPLNEGQLVVQALNGTRNAINNRGEMMFSLDGRPQENSGRTMGAVIMWSGNYKFRVDTRSENVHRLVVGIDEEHSEYHLEKGKSFTTPVVAFAFSQEGKGGVSRAYHRWARLNNRLHNGNALRKMLLNSWEGVYMDVNQKGMEEMMDGISQLGGELFVMDDGWFGTKYRRTVDDKALGDWKTDTVKLPKGVPALVSAAKQRGIEFGIWIEPEMTNNPSELYDAHPDWVLKAPQRDLVYGRGGTQLVLDLSNPAVQDYIFSIVDGLKKEIPDLDYIKWDANMNVSAYGSQYLKRQSHLIIEYWRGFAKVCDRIRAAYPDLTIQTCASGGGRANWGVLPWFDEFWVSDNTDALQRIYMQWGTSYFFPAITMASHISATPNHTVFRTTSIKYRCDVAMSGRLGMEIQPKNMTDDEKAVCRQAIADYKRIRPIVQFGDIYRIVSPYDNHGFASMMHVAPDKHAAVFYWWRISNFQDDHFSTARFAGLDPDRMYKVTELNSIDRRPLAFEGKSFSGRFLMENGLNIPVSNDPKYPGMKSDWSSRVLLLEAL